MDPVTEEVVLDSKFDEIDGKIPTEEELKNEDMFFSTKDKGVSIFLNARGFSILGWQTIKQTDGRGRTRRIKVVFFPGGGVTRRAMIEYHTRDKADNFNVNAKCFNTAMRTINSIFQN